MNKLALRNHAGLSLLDDFFTDFWDIGWNIRREYDQEPAHYFYDEKSKEHTITIPAPGFSRDNIQIEVDGTGIKIEGELKNEELQKRIGNKKFSYHMMKLGVDPKSVEAQLTDGILEIKLKTQESKTTKKIEIK